MSEMIVTLWRTFSRGRRSTYTWPAFVETFVADPEVVRDKRSVAGFSLAAFEDNRRTLSRIEKVYALTFDFDEGDTTVEDAKALIPDMHGVAYTTFSHTPEHPKIRVIYPLSKPVGAEEYARIWTWAFDRITAQSRSVDESTCDASRFWYLPSHRPKGLYVWRELEGEHLDVEAVLREAPHLSRPFSDPGPRMRPTPPGKGRVSVGVSADETYFGRAFMLAGMAFDVLENGSLSVKCPWAAQHTSGYDGDSSTVIFPPTSDGMLGLFHCSHAHCVRRQTSDLLDVLPMRALEGARDEHGRGLVRVKVVNGWHQRLPGCGDMPELRRLVLRCKPREGAVFAVTVQEKSALHRHLDGLPLASLLGRRLDVSLEGARVTGARIVQERSRKGGRPGR